jgi:hypothetical protein
LHRHAQGINETFQYDQQIRQSIQRLTDDLPVEAQKEFPIPGKLFCQHEITEKEIRNALGRYFEAKVTLARKTGLIEDAVAGSINKLHLIRNTAYHAGQKHEGILNSLAVFYITLACEVFLKFSDFEFSLCSSGQIPYRAQKYLDNNGVDSFNAAWKRVGKIVEPRLAGLVANLAEDLTQTIDEVDGTISFCSMDGSMPREQVILTAQQLSKKAMAYADEHAPSDVTGPFRIEWLRENYPLECASDPVSGWRKRLESLRTETDLHKALDKYENFMEQTEDLRQAIDEFGMEIDAMIQKQVDERRGK